MAEKSEKNASVVGCVILGMICIIAGSMVVKCTEPTPKPAGTLIAVHLTAVDLVSRIATNEVRAKADLNDRPLIVSGTIMEISSDGDQGADVIVEGVGDVNVVAHLPKKERALNLMPGQDIQLSCSGGVIQNPPKLVGCRPV